MWSFKILEPGKHYREAWHVQYVCEHLELVKSGEIKRLIINLPPRCLKSISAAVAFPTWTWIDWPESRFIFSSYSMELGVSHHLKRRRIIDSDWYKDGYSDSFQIRDDENRKTSFENTKSGQYIITSSSGTVAGKGGDIILVDDPVNPEKSESKSHLEESCNHVSYLSTRLNDQNEGRIVIIMQRCHELDPVGKILHREKKDLLEEKDQKEWQSIIIPAEFDKPKTFVFPICRDKHTGEKKTVEVKEGDVLFPDQFPKERLDKLKLDLGSFRYSAQFQQKPSPAGGGLVKGQWFKPVAMFPPIKSRVWSWDLAAKKEQVNDYCVGILIGEGENFFAIEKVVRKKLLFPDQKRLMVQSYNGYPSYAVLIEDKSSGEQMTPTLQEETIMPIIPIQPKGDKTFRLSTASSTIESGRMLVPEDATWLFDFLEEFEHFPKAAYDDQVDALTQFINWKISKQVGEFEKTSDRSIRPKKIYFEEDVSFDSDTLAPSLTSGENW